MQYRKICVNEISERHDGSMGEAWRMTPLVEQLIFQRESEQLFPAPHGGNMGNGF